MTRNAHLRLRDLYHRAGVREYWIVDARRSPPHLEVLLHRPGGYVSAPISQDGYQRSGVLAADVRFDREAERAGFHLYRLDVR